MAETTPSPATQVSTLCERWKQHIGTSDTRATPEQMSKLNLTEGTLKSELKSYATPPNKLTFRPAKFVSLGAEESNRIRDGSLENIDRTVACIQREERPLSGGPVNASWSSAERSGDLGTEYHLNLLTCLFMDESLQGNFKPEEDQYLRVETYEGAPLTVSIQDFDVLESRGLHAANLSQIKSMDLFQQGEDTPVRRQQDFEGNGRPYVERWVEVIPGKRPQDATD